MTALRSLCCLFAFTLLVTGLRAEKPAEKSDQAGDCSLEQFLGTYKIVSGEMDGKKIPADKMHFVKTVITKEKIVSYDSGENEVYAASFSLQPGKNGGCHISMKAQRPGTEGENGAASGLISRKGNTLKLIYSLPNAEAPTDFKTKSGQHLFVMELMNEKTATDPESLKERDR